MPPKGNPKGTQAQITSYYDPGAVKQLRDLSERTEEPQSKYLREALDELLGKYGWRKLVGGGFGLMDAKFATHPADAERAKKAIAAAKAAGATFEDFEREIVWHCHKEAPAWRSEHTGKQVARAKKLWGRDS
jgi:Ribbon-helix-helix domain